MFWRVRLKLAAWYTGALALILLTLGFAIYTGVRHSLDQEIEASLSRSRDDLLSNPAALAPTATPAPAAFGSSVILANFDDDDDATRTAEPRDDDDDSSGKSTPEPGDDHDASSDDDDDPRPGDDDDGDSDDPATIIATDVFFVTTDASGAVLWNPRNVGLSAIPLSDLVASAGSTEHRTTIDAGDDRYRMTSLPLDSAAPAAAYLHIGRSLESRDSQLASLARTLVIGGLAGVALAAVGGVALAGRALIPVRAALETQRRFVSDASHELRTPLAVVRANAELLARHPESAIEDNLEILEAISSETGHMAALVADLLTLARADEGRLELQRERFSLDALLAELIRDMTPIAAYRDVSLTGDFTPVDLLADRQRIRQVAVILIDNALKYAPPGTAVVVATRLTRGNVDLSVTDAGPGIPPAEQQRIFDRFYRADLSRSRAAPGGTGLGLAIARSIAEAHGGRLTVESELGQGTTFTARIPENLR